MKLIIENGGSKLDWTLLESNNINTSECIEKIFSHISFDFTY